MQAMLVLISSVVISIGFSAFEMRSIMLDQRQLTLTQAEELLMLAEGGASRAAWTLDPVLAQEVVSGILSRSGVVAAEIRANLRGDNQQVLARLVQPYSYSGLVVEWVAKRYFSDTARSSRELKILNQSKAVQIGTLFVEYAPQQIAHQFVNLAYLTLTTGLIESLLIALVLLGIAEWLLTIPLRRAAIAIANIQPDKLDDDTSQITVPELHTHNELGQLLIHTNHLLTRLHTSQGELRRLATKDSLTGLANRSLIQYQLEKMLASAKRSGEKVGVIFLDLDRFKTVNDSLGHDIGDKLLKRVAQILLDEVRQQDAVGRLGGDEFLVAIPSKELNNIIAIAERISFALSVTTVINTHELRTRASLGIAIFPEDGKDADQLMRRADIAMYQAKSDSTNLWHLFSDDMRVSFEENMNLELALRGAIEQKELSLYLQPQISTQTNQLAACEALLRWQHKGKFISPEIFIEVAENSGLIFEIGDWVFSESCKILQQWGHNAIPIAVNVSGHQLMDKGFVSRILATVDEFGVSRGLIEFEITESTLMQDLDLCLTHLNQLRDEGFKISIDDFGTGYSSLSHLTRLPIDKLKIDRSFVSGSQRSPIVLSTIIALGKALDIPVVAEGVETEAQRQSLEDNGCDLLQGYLFGKPMPVDMFESEFLFLLRKVSS